MIKESISYKVFKFFNTIFMLFIIIATLYPLLYVVFASFSDSNELVAYTGLLYKPLNFNVDAYIRVFHNSMIFTGFSNTFFILIVGLIVNMVLTVSAAFVLSRKDLPGRDTITFFVILTMFFSGGLIPQYLNIHDLGLYDSFWAIILSGAVNTFNLIVMRTAFSGVPESLVESARLDGAGWVRILIRIMIPLVMPTIAVIILYYAVAHWNSWFNAFVYLRERDKFPLQLVLREILIQSSTNDMMTDVVGTEATSVAESIKYAVIVVSVVPILVVYPWLQKYFVKGTMIGAVKG